MPEIAGREKIGALWCLFRSRNILRTRMRCCHCRFLQSVVESG